MNVFSIPVIFTGTMYVQAESETIAAHLAELTVNRRVILSRDRATGNLVTGNGDEESCDASMMLSGDVIVAEQPQPMFGAPLFIAVEE